MMICVWEWKKGEKIYVYDKSQITHLGAKTVDSKYKEIEYSKIGIGTGQRFISEENIMDF